MADAMIDDKKTEQFLRAMMEGDVIDNENEAIANAQYVHNAEDVTMSGDEQSAIASSDEVDNTQNEFAAASEVLMTGENQSAIATNGNVMQSNDDSVPADEEMSQLVPDSDLVAAAPMILKSVTTHSFGLNSSTDIPQLRRI